MNVVANLAAPKTTYGRPPVPHGRRRNSAGEALTREIALPDAPLHLSSLFRYAGLACIFDRAASAAFHSPAPFRQEACTMNVVANPAAPKFTTEDLPYHTVGGETLLAKLYRPQGAGPFPAVVGVHGGAWTSGDRNNNKAIDEALAAAGVVVLALDFRLAPKAPYPASVADVNQGTRWLKAHAEKYGSRAGWVGMVVQARSAHIRRCSVRSVRPIRATPAPRAPKPPRRMRRWPSSWRAGRSPIRWRATAWRSRRRTSA